MILSFVVHVFESHDPVIEFPGAVPEHLVSRAARDEPEQQKQPGHVRHAHTRLLFLYTQYCLANFLEALLRNTACESLSTTNEDQ